MTTEARTSALVNLLLVSGVLVLVASGGSALLTVSLNRGHAWPRTVVTVVAGTFALLVLAVAVAQLLRRPSGTGFAQRRAARLVARSRQPHWDR